MEVPIRHRARGTLPTLVRYTCKNKEVQVEVDRPGGIREVNRQLDVSGVLASDPGCGSPGL